MKLRKGFIMREVAGNIIAVAVGETAVDFNGLITLNETGAFLWKHLQKGTDEDELLKLMLDEYEIDEATAKADILTFIEKCRKADMLEEDQAVK